MIRRGQVWWVDLTAEQRGSEPGFRRPVVVIQDDYFKFLGRPASPSEVDGFVNAFEHGASNELVIAGFISSDEYYRRVQAFPS